MLNRSRTTPRSPGWRADPGAPVAPSGPRRRPVAVGLGSAGGVAGGRGHPLVDPAVNERLYGYESRVKAAFDGIVPALRQIAAVQREPDFPARAQRIAQGELGLDLPVRLLDDAWVSQLDMRALFAWCVFQTYRRVSDEFYRDDPLDGRSDSGFDGFLQDCGFHLMDVTPCADGRLAHAISYVLRLPYGPVRRKSYAGALFDVENTVAKWVETEFLRFREGRPNLADAPTRYLKVVVYHYSSRDPEHEGCAAHGSDTAKAARAGVERLAAFQQAVQNSFCCGASVDLLLIGMDTDTDAIQVHVPDRQGRFDLDQGVDAAGLYDATRGVGADDARRAIRERAVAAAPGTPDDGMVALVARLVENNFAQIEYVRRYHGGAYGDVGHAERFIGAGIGFEEIQLRNLTYFAYLDTVEEGAPDLDVGIKIFTGLNISRGLPAPVVVRFDYHGDVPGARDRAMSRCERVCAALRERYRDLASAGLLHTLATVRDCDRAGELEVVGSSLTPRTGPLPGALDAAAAAGGGH